MKLFALTLAFANTAFGYYQNCNNLETGDLFSSTFAQLKPNINCSLIWSNCFEEIQGNMQALWTLLDYCDGSEGKTFGGNLSDNHFQRLLASHPDALELFQRNEARNCSNVGSLKDVFLDNPKLYSSVSLACLSKIKYPFSKLLPEDLLALNKEAWLILKDNPGIFDGGLSVDALEKAILKGDKNFVETISQSFIYLPRNFINQMKAETSKIVHQKMNAIHQYLLKQLPQGIPLNDTCPICKDDFDGQRLTRVLSCRHGYHHECIDPWIKEYKTCPCCRKVVLEKGDEVDFDAIDLFEKSCSDGLVYEVSLFLNFLPNLNSSKCTYLAIRGNHLQLTAFLLDSNPRNRSEMIKTLRFAIKMRNLRMIALINDKTNSAGFLPFETLLDLVGEKEIKDILFKSNENFIERLRNTTNYESQWYVGSDEGDLKKKKQILNSRRFNAIYFSNFEKAYQLYEVYVSIFKEDTTENFWNTFIKLAIDQRNLELLNFLAVKKQPKDTCNFEILSFVCFNGLSDVLEYLLSFCKDVKFSDEEWRQTLSFAFSNKSLENSIKMATMLKNSGSFPYGYLTVLNNNQFNQIQELSGYVVSELKDYFKPDKAEILDYIFSPSSNPMELQLSFSYWSRLMLKTIIEKIVDYKVFDFFVKCLSAEAINFQDENGETPLIFAASLRKTEAVKILLNHGANPFLRKQNNENAFVVSERHSETFEALINFGDREANLKNFKLSVIASANYDLLAKYVLSERVNPEVAKEFMMESFNSGNDVFIRLLDSIVDHNYNDELGRNWLMLAAGAKQNNDMTVKVLLEKIPGLDIDSTDFNGMNASNHAGEAGNYSVWEFLVNIPRIRW